MTALDPPAAAARRQWALDRILEDLIGWGSPLDVAPARAAAVLDHVLDAGYALPVVLQPAPAAGRGSTTAGRALARRILTQSRAGCDCGPAHLGDPGEQHLPGCPVRTAADRGTATPHEPPSPPAGAPGGPAPVYGHPPNTHRATEGVGRE